MYINGLAQIGAKLDFNSYSRVIEAAYANSRTSYSLESVTSIILYFFEKYQDFTGESHPALSADTLARLIPSLEFITDPNGEIIELFPEDYEPLIDQYFSKRFKKCDYHFSHFMSGSIRYYRYLETM